MFIQEGTFLLIALGSAFIWAAFYVVTGYLIGPYWILFTQNLENFKYFLIAVPVIVICTGLITFYFRKKRKVNSKLLTN